MTVLQVGSGLEAISLAILLVSGFLPFFFLAQSYLTPPPTSGFLLPRNRDRVGVITCCFVFLLGPFAASTAVLRIVSDTGRQGFSLITIIIILQNFVQFLYRLPMLLLLNHSSTLVRSTKSTISDKRLDIHNIVLAILITISFVLAIIHTLILPTSFSSIVPTTLSIVADLFPIPLQCHFTRIANTPRIRRIWLFIILIQLFSVTVAALGIPRQTVFSIIAASFTVLWFGSVTTLFYSLYASPITLSSAPVVDLSPLSPTSLTGLAAELRTSSPQVFYENTSHRNQRQSSRGLISEDFTALRDPFASPTRAGPHAKSPEPYAPVTPPPATTTTTANAHCAPQVPCTPTPQSKTHSSSGARHGYHYDKTGVKNSLQQISSRFTHTSSIEKKESMQSLQFLANKSKETSEEQEGENNNNKRAENESFFLNDEALLSQILLHSLTTETIGPTSRTTSHSRPTNFSKNDATLLPVADSTTTRKTRKTHCRNRNVERIFGAGNLNLNLKHAASNFVFRQSPASASVSAESRSIFGTPQSSAGVAVGQCDMKVKAQDDLTPTGGNGNNCSCWWDYEA